MKPAALGFVMTCGALVVSGGCGGNGAPRVAPDGGPGSDLSIVPGTDVQMDQVAGPDGVTDAGAAADRPAESRDSASAPRTVRWIDVSETHLPATTKTTETMIVRSVDIDGDGDLDVVLACEYQRNRLLLNDGAGHFTDLSETNVPPVARDSEDVAIADFDGDKLPDLVFVTEDGTASDLHLNMGGGRFVDKPGFPGGVAANAVVTLDLEGDGDGDLIVGKRGQNVVLVNDGRANFTDQTATRLPAATGTTQDLELADVDGDGDLDLLVGNEGQNRLLLNNGSGVFQDATNPRLPSTPPHDETRGVYVADLDGDGDRDIFFANAGRAGGGLSRQDRVLINDGKGFFTDETAARLPADDEEAMGGRLVDLDRDGDVDIIIATYAGREGPVTPYRVFKNDGRGVFTHATPEFFPASATGHGFDVEAADFNGDGYPDVYLGSGRSQDRLLLTQVE